MYVRMYKNDLFNYLQKNLIHFLYETLSSFTAKRKNSNLDKKRGPKIDHPLPCIPNFCYQCRGG